MLKLDKITKSFGDKTVLSEFSAELHDGLSALIMGPSGAGKTTLLRIIAQLETADGGSVALPGTGRISFMFQEPRLFPWMNAVENVTAVLPEPDHTAAAELLRELGLENETDSRPGELSGGMQRRVALARTLIFPADLYLFDEPFAGLDPETAAAAADTIFRHTAGKTVLIVSHDRSMLPDSIETLIIERHM